jgi:hypothetical protein
MKRNITNQAELNQAMEDLQRRVKVQEIEMKTNYEEVKENLRLKNVVKNKFEQLAQTPEIQRTLLNTAMGMVLGFAAKRLSEILSEQSLNRTVENVLNHSVHKLETRNPESLVAKGISLLRKYTPRDSPIYPYVRYKNDYLQL